MILETRKNYDNIIDIITPPNSITLEKIHDFSSIYVKFDSEYKKSIGKVYTHCSIVKDKMEEMKRKKAWEKSIPIIKRSYQELEDVCNHWFYSDDDLVRSMDQFLRGVKTELKDVQTELLKNPPDEQRAFTLLQDFLSAIDPTIAWVSGQLNELEVISKRLD